MSRNYTLSFIQANAYAMGLFIPIAVAYMLPYGLIYGWNVLVNDLMIYFTNIPIFIISLIIGTISHEALHAACWLWLDDIPKEQVEFGFKWSTLTPFVHCGTLVAINNYRWGVAMPGLILGVIPYLMALSLHIGWLLGFSLFFSLAAGGDLLILWLLKDVADGHFVQDHPDLIGCTIVNNQAR